MASALPTADTGVAGVVWKCVCGSNTYLMLSQ